MLNLAKNFSKTKYVLSISDIITFEVLLCGTNHGSDLHLCIMHMIRIRRSLIFEKGNYVDLVSVQSLMTCSKEIGVKL